MNEGECRLGNFAGPGTYLGNFAGPGTYLVPIPIWYLSYLSP